MVGSGSTLPLLANIALDGMERLFGAEDARGRPSLRRGLNRGVSLIRYADDPVMTAPTRDILRTQVVPALTTFLGERGLEPSGARTWIVHAKRQSYGAPASTCSDSAF